MSESRSSPHRWGLRLYWATDLPGADGTMPYRFKLRRHLSPGKAVDIDFVTSGGRLAWQEVAVVHDDLDLNGSFWKESTQNYETFCHVVQASVALLKMITDALDGSRAPNGQPIVYECSASSSNTNNGNRSNTQSQQMRNNSAFEGGRYYNNEGGRFSGNGASSGSASVAMNGQRSSSSNGSSMSRTRSSYRSSSTNQAPEVPEYRLCVVPCMDGAACRYLSLETLFRLDQGISATIIKGDHEPWCDLDAPIAWEAFCRREAHLLPALQFHQDVRRSYQSVQAAWRDARRRLANRNVWAREVNNGHVPHAALPRQYTLAPSDYIANGHLVNAAPYTRFNDRWRRR